MPPHLGSVAPPKFKVCYATGGMIIRFRLNAVGIAADIEKAFLQIGLNPIDRDVTRFLWITDPSNPKTDSNLSIYRFARVPFGLKSSPFLLSATLNRHLDQSHTDVANMIKNNIYVDNVILSVSTPEAGLDLYVKAKNLFKKASINLREWTSNSKELLKTIPKDDQLTQEKVKILGLIWDVEQDLIYIQGIKCQIENSDNSRNITKRIILKMVASIFDPLGLLCPTTLKAKLFIQQLWKEKYGWDERISTSLQNEWTKIMEEFLNLSSYSMPRYIGDSIPNRVNYSLAGFCDASALAYATSIYLLVSTQNGITVNLIFSKSRLAPVKRQISIPRLELMGFVIGLRCMNFVATELNLTLEQRVLWTDSQCVLGWITSLKPLPSFVANRIKEIRSSKGVSFRYIEGIQNPADVCTRGTSLFKLRSNRLWWHVPEWLQTPIKSWPTWNFPEINQNTLESTIIHDPCNTIMYETSFVVHENTK